MVLLAMSLAGCTDSDIVNLEIQSNVLEERPKDGWHTDDTLKCIHSTLGNHNFCYTLEINVKNLQEDKDLYVGWGWFDVVAEDGIVYDNLRGDGPETITAGTEINFLLSLHFSAKDGESEPPKPKTLRLYQIGGQSELSTPNAVVEVKIPEASDKR